MITRPLLAGKIEELEKINFPIYATPKLDGIRVLKVDGKVVKPSGCPCGSKFQIVIYD